MFELEPARRLRVRTRTGLTVIWSTPAGITEVTRATFIALRSLRVVLTALREGEKEKERKIIIQRHFIMFFFIYFFYYITYYEIQIQQKIRVQ